MATDTTTNTKGNTDTDTELLQNTEENKSSVHNENLHSADVKTDSDAAKPFELHVGDRLEGTPVDRFRAVRGVNPNTGATPGLVQNVAADATLAKLSLAIRRMAVGSFQSLNGDLRTVEASAKAAIDFSELFRAHGIGFYVMSEDERNNDDSPVSDIAFRPARAEREDPDRDNLRAEDVKTAPNADVARKNDDIKPVGNFEATPTPNATAPTTTSGPDDKSKGAAKADNSPTKSTTDTGGDKPTVGDKPTTK